MTARTRGVQVSTLLATLSLFEKAPRSKCDAAQASAAGLGLHNLEKNTTAARVP